MFSEASVSHSVHGGSAFGEAAYSGVYLQKGMHRGGLRLEGVCIWGV